MPTVIDSLIVTLGLDSKDVDSKAPGVRKKLADLEKDASKSSKSTDDLSKSLKNTGAALGSFLALIGGTIAVRSFVKDTIETNTQLFFLSRNLDMNTQKLFAWGAAAQEIGGKGATIQNFMRTIAAMPGELMTGKMPQLLPLFARLGINFRQPFDQIMLDMSKRLSGMDRKMAYSFGMASGIPEDVLNLLLQGPNAVQAAMGRTKGFGPTEKEAASAARLKKEFTDIELQFVKIGYDLLQMVTPALEKFLGFLQAIGAWAQKHEGIVSIISGLAAALAGVAATATALGAVAIAWEALTGAIMASMPVLAVIGIVAALGAAILLLWQDYKVWSEGGKSFFDWQGWTNLVSAAANAWQTLGEKIAGAVGWVGKWIDKAAIAMGADPSMTTAGGQSTAEQQALEAYNRAHPNHQMVAYNATQRKEAQEIAVKEGFYAPQGGYVPNANGKGRHFDANANQNIPQKAHNPGDIEYGDFALKHGAIGYVIAKGGKKIATFPDDQIGFNAIYALLATKGYSGLTPQQVISRWQTGSATALLNGVAGASSVPSSVSSSSNTNSTSNDNSRVTHIGTINLQNPAGGTSITPSMARGMDWSTLLTQQNFGLQ
jgi:hypothetical protein